MIEVHNQGHSHRQPTAVENIRLGFFLNLAFTLLEVIGGFWTNSLAILSDALHDLGDSFSLGLSWRLEKVARRPPSATFTYGYRRFSLLAALINGIILIVGSLFVLSEAIPRLFRPEPSHASGMVVLAVLGIAVNGFAALRIHRGRTLNERLVAWHFLEDVLGWVAILIVGLVIMVREVYRLDPLLSILITFYVLWNVGRNLRTTLIVFLQGVPAPMSVELLESRILTLPNVLAIHDSHVWTLDGEHFILSCHVVVAEGLAEKKIVDLKCNIRRLTLTLGIQHVTIEVEYEHETCELNH